MSIELRPGYGYAIDEFTGELLFFSEKDPIGRDEVTGELQYIHSNKERSLTDRKLYNKVMMLNLKTFELTEKESDSDLKKPNPSTDTKV